MLALDSPRWKQLEHAYGSAENIPALLMQLRTAPRPKDLRSEPWYSLWSSLCHQMDVYTASYAAAPHLAALAEGKSPKEQLDYLSLVSAIEVYRHRAKAAPIPDDLRIDYLAAVKATAEMLHSCLNSEWDEPSYRNLLASFAGVQGHTQLSNTLLAIDDLVCPNCDFDLSATE